MNKIGIITFHRAINYGAMLQAVALQKALSGMKYDAEIIDYVDQLYEHYRISYKSSNYFRTIVKYLLSINVRKRNKRFSQFLIENTKLSAKKYNNESVQFLDESQYKAFFTGSDQTFNPIIVNHDSNYVLSFVNNKHKCNAYAASIGLNSLSEENGEWLKKNVEEYHSILVREKTGMKLLNSLGIENTSLVCDPTFLLSVEAWKKMQKKIHIPKHYILNYGFKENKLMNRKMEEVSEETGYPIYTISDRIRPNREGYRQFRGIGPGEWLYIINNADYIVTNSFHGMIFSFIFNKQVWVADSNDDTFSRMKDFLIRMNCEHRILIEESCTQTDMKIRYDNVNLLMKKYILESKVVLAKTLEDYENE